MTFSSKKGDNLFRYTILVVILCGLLLSAGCTENGSGTSPDKSSDGTQLLGLVNGRTLEYLQTDTLTTFIPDYRVTVTSSVVKIRMSGAEADWIISLDARPVINLKLSDPYVLQNGYWHPSLGGDTLVYFAEPAVIMKRSVGGSDKWTSYTPMYFTGTSNTAWIFYNAYFGFYTEKKTAGTEQLLLPAGAFTTSRFDVDLYGSQYDSVAVAQSTEYYAPAIGLAKLVFKGQGLNRTLSLIKYY
jgi:hypothetical protein